MRIWDAITGKELTILNGHSGCIWSVSLSKDGKKVASGSDDKTIIVWEMSTGNKL